MDSVLKAHLRYPQALLMVQATMYGRYHLTNPSSFYIANNAWELAPTSGTGSPSQPLPTDGLGNTLRFVPEYEILQLPGSTGSGFSLIEPMDPLSQGDRIQTLAALVTASCDYQNYGRITAFVTPTRNATEGPAVVNSRIQSNPTISKYLTFTDQLGSSVSLGTTLIVPIAGSIIYLRPLYVSSSANPFPQLTQYIVLYGNQVSMEPTLGAALAAVFGGATSSIGGSGPGQISASVRALLASAQSYYSKGQAALKDENLAAYSNDMQMVGKLIAEAESELKKPAKTTGTTKSKTGSSTSGGSNSKSGTNGTTTTSTTTTTPSNSTTSTTPSNSTTSTTSTTTIAPSRSTTTTTTVTPGISASGPSHTAKPTPVAGRGQKAGES
jgi:uncharacterized membrane protein (UPF0182 family)